LDCADSALLTDLYQLKMVETYLARGIVETAVFEFFVRRLPPGRGFLVAAGLGPALEFLEGLQFGEEDVAWLQDTGRFGDPFLQQLGGFRFAGDVWAMPEGTIFFPDEPILQVIAPLPQAQLVETRLINILHFQSLIASKAARHVLLAQGRGLIDFGLRRAHGAEAGLMAARASYLAGYDGTATVLAGKRFGVPLFGTMAHSFIQAFDDEGCAFETFAGTHPDDIVLLLDTYDTEAAARKIVALAPRLAARGLAIRAVRLDSGDLVALSTRVRAILDEGGLANVAILVSGGLDDEDIRAMVEAGAPVDSFGIGTSLTTSADAPALDCAYKLEEYAGVARRKRSTGKATLPGRKQVRRRFDSDGRMCGDLISLAHETLPGESLLHPVMQQGRRVASPSLDEARACAKRNLAQLPASLQQLEPSAAYRVETSEALQALVRAVDARTGGAGEVA
jgi:nicotinate phosphoribosyltransferase